MTIALDPSCPSVSPMVQPVMLLPAAINLLLAESLDDQSFALCQNNHWDKELRDGCSSRFKFCGLGATKFTDKQSRKRL